MTKQVTHIACPKEWESTNDFDSHRPLLWLAVSKTEEVIMEFGCGVGSTSLLEKIENRNFVSYETNAEWADKFESTLWVNDYIEDIADSYYHIGVLFVDAAPAEVRKEIVSKFHLNADVVVVHDTEPGAEYVYGMSEVLSTFKYRLDYQPEGKPHTTAVSNRIDVTKWV